MNKGNSTNPANTEFLAECNSLASHLHHPKLKYAALQRGWCLYDSM